MRIAHDPIMRVLLKNYMNQEHETERRCHHWMPAANIRETDEAYLLELAVPGFSKEDFKINLEKDMLTISSERDKEKKTEEKVEHSCCRREFGHRNFSRSFYIPEAVDKDGIKAEYTNGILLITLPKKEVVKVKKEIEVL